MPRTRLSRPIGHWASAVALGITVVMTAGCSDHHAARAVSSGFPLVLINDDVWHSHVVSVRLPEQAPTVTLERLTAPSAWARNGVVLGGQHFGAQTRTGNLRGARLSQQLTAGPGRYRITLPAASAALLTVSQSSG